MLLVESSSSLQELSQWYPLLGYPHNLAAQLASPKARESRKNKVEPQCLRPDLRSHSLSFPHNCSDYTVLFHVGEDNPRCEYQEARIIVAIFEAPTIPGLTESDM